MARSLPFAGAFHGGPGLFRLQGVALLQKLDGDSVRRTDEGHAAVAGRAVDGDAAVQEFPAGLVDVIDGEGKMAEVAPAGIFLRIPVVGQLDLGLRALVGGQEDKGIAPGFVVLAPGLG